MDAITDHTTYTISSCLSLCEARSLIKECGCRNMEMSGEFSNDTLLNYYAYLGNFSFGTIIHLQIDIPRGGGRGGRDFTQKSSGSLLTFHERK